MQYRTLGHTQIKVSIAGFGASPLGDVFGPIDPTEGRRAVHLAIDEGINFFDVSPYYGATLAEARLGEALQGRRKEVVLSTKCGRYGLDNFDYSAYGIRHSVNESLRRLHTDYVDLLFAHDVEFANLDQIIYETIPAMRRLQEEGKARFVGIAGYPLSPLIKIAKRAPVDIILSYCHYNLLIDHLDSGLMPFADKHGIAVINASGLHMGVLTDDGAPDWHPAPKDVRDAGQKAAEFCRSRGIDLAEVALRFCFSYPKVASTLVGMSSRQQVRDSIRALSTERDPEIMAELKTILAPASNITWPSGLLENHDQLP